MCNKITQYLFLFLVIIIPVKMKQVINAKPMRARYKAIHRNILLQGTACAYAEYLQRSQLRFYRSRCKINIGKRIQFVHHDINIIGTDTGRHNRDSFTANIAGMGDEFAVLLLYFYAVKVLAHLRHAPGVANSDNGGSKFIRALRRGGR